METHRYWLTHQSWIVVLIGLLVLINDTWSIMPWTFFIGLVAIIVGILSVLFQGFQTKNPNQPNQKRR